MINVEQKFYRPKQGAKYLGISLSGYWILIKKGLIPTTKLSERVTITSKEELDKFVLTRV